ncbi:MAG: hypothetical protein IPL52_16910 [Flavobacteriales bacterium]|nr:hypothetical protein [Flavobacteriales bacterium]
MRSNIKLPLYKLAVLKLLALLNNVIDKLTANALVFPAPPVTLLALQNLSDQLTAAIAAATGGGVEARAVRNNLVLEVRSALRLVADYVRIVSNGDAALLAKSGFELRKLPEPINEVGVPKNVKAEATDEEGSLLVRWSKTVGARMFRVEQASGDPALGTVTWTTVLQTGRQRATLTGLEPFKAGYFRVVAIGITHEGMPSDIVLGRAA